MEISEKVKNILLYTLMFVLILSINIFWVTQKKGLFTDEAMGIRDSNFPKLIYDDKLKVKYEKFLPKGVMTGKEIKKLLLWDDASITDAIKDITYLYAVNENRVHTNLYYSILRFWFVGTDFNDIDYTIKTGCTLNLIFFAFAFFFMYKLLAMLFNNEDKYIILGLIVAFLNGGTISNLIFIREYYLQMTLFVALTYFVIKIFKEYTERKNICNNKYLWILAIIIALTNLSGYFSLIYVLLLLGVFLIFLILKNDKSTVIFIIKIILLSLLITQILYPLYFSGFASYHATDIYKNIENEFNIFQNIKFIYDQLVTNLLHYVFYIPIVTLCGFCLFIPKISNTNNKKYFWVIFIISILWASIVLCLVNYPRLYQRYIVVIFPLVALLIPYLCYKKKSSTFLIGLFLTMYITLLFTPMSNIQFMYKEEREVIDLVQNENLPIVRKEERNWWDKYTFIPYLKDNRAFYINSTELIPKGTKYILILVNPKEINSQYNLYSSHMRIVGFIKIKD